MQRRLFVELRIVLRRALRIVTFRHIAMHPAPLRPIAVIAVLILTGCIGVAYDTLVSGGTGLTFNEYGITAALAGWALMLARIVLMRRKWNPRLGWALSDIATVGAAASVAMAIAYAALLVTGVFDGGKTDWTLWIWYGLAYGVLGLSFLLVWRAGRSLWWGEGRFRAVAWWRWCFYPSCSFPANPRFTAMAPIGRAEISGLCRPPRSPTLRRNSQLRTAKKKYSVAAQWL